MEKKVFRIESGATNGQQDSLKLLLEMVHLPPCLVKNEFVVSNPRQKNAGNDITDSLYDKGYDEAIVALKNAEVIIGKNVRCNEQQFAWYRNLFDYKTGSKSYLKFEEEMRRIIEMSIPCESIGEKERYFTKNELSYYCGLIGAAEREGTLNLQEMEKLESYCRELLVDELSLNNTVILEPVLDVFQSAYGNRGYWEKSNAYCDVLLDILCVSRRLRKTIDIFYARWWNEYTQNKTSDYTQLYKLIALSDLIESEGMKAFLEKKIKNQSVLGRKSISRSSKGSV